MTESTGRSSSAKGFVETSITAFKRTLKIGGPIPKLKPNEKLLRKTQSLCPVCYRMLPAIVFERDGKVWIRKICPEHGEIEEIYWGDAELYRKALKWEVKSKPIKVVYTKAEAPCPFTCGLCPYHMTYTALANIVLTNRCDLSCWYCFFYAEKAGYVYEPSLEELREMIRNLRKQYPRGGLAVQLTGGEPTLRDDLVEIVKMIKEEGVQHIQLNTHGLRFAYDPNGVELAKKLREAGLNTVYLSFDGVSPSVNFKNHWEIPFIFDTFRKARVTSVVLVPTLIKGWNTDELGAIIVFAAKNMDIVRGVNFQPVSLTGQMSRSEREKARVTIPDAIKYIEEQTDGQISRDAWYPTPVTDVISDFVEAFTGEPKLHMPIHPACGMATYVYVKRESDGSIEFTPITKFIDVEGFFEYLKEKTEELKKGKNRYVVGLKILYNLRKFIDSEKQPKDINLWKLIFNIFIKHNYKALGEFHYNFLYIGMMHFMDLYNYDIQRVMRCGIHYLVPGGKVIPFCTFNVLPDLYRDRVQKEHGIPIKEWIRIKGIHTIGEAIKYKRNIKKLESSELYRKTYADFREWLNKR